MWIILCKIILTNLEHLKVQYLQFKLVKYQILKKVEGATTLILKDDGTTNTLIPSNIVNQLELNFEGYTT